VKHFYQTVSGWFSFRDLYAQIVAEARDGAHFVEVGSWKGRSAAFMAVEIANSGKQIAFDCVDTWLGSNEKKHSEDPAVIAGTLYSDFLKNTAPARRYIRAAIRMPSVRAAQLYADGSLDFVFIDAAHDYENVRRDIGAWRPKIRVGGALAGDDFHFAGVTRATVDAFGQELQLIKGTGTGRQWKWTRRG